MLVSVVNAALFGVYIFVCLGNVYALDDLVATIVHNNSYRCNSLEVDVVFL